MVSPPFLGVATCSLSFSGATSVLPPAATATPQYAGLISKAGKEHRVPLSDAALAMLERARPLRDNANFVFPSPTKTGRPLSDMTLGKLIRELVLRRYRTVFEPVSGIGPQNARTLPMASWN